MTVAWLLNVIGLFVTTTSALLTFLYIYKSSEFSDKFSSAEAVRAYVKHQRLLAIAVGLLAFWLVIQYLGVILL